MKLRYCTSAVSCFSTGIHVVGLELPQNRAFEVLVAGLTRHRLAPGRRQATLQAATIGKEILLDGMLAAH
jgi:hypothetical protein